MSDGRKRQYLGVALVILLLSGLPGCADLIFETPDFDNPHDPINQEPDTLEWIEVTAAADPFPRYAFETTLFDGSIWVGNGQTADIGLSDLWRSPDGSQWIPVDGDIPGSALCAFETHLYIYGGDQLYFSVDGTDFWDNTIPDPFNGQGWIQLLVMDGKLWAVDPVTGAVWSSPAPQDPESWEQHTDGDGFPGSGNDVSSAGHNGYIWIIGGDLGAEIWRFDPQTGWDAVAEVASFDRTYPQVVSFQGLLWVIGGFIRDSGVASDAWYSAEGTEWAQTTAPWTARDRFGSVVMNDRLYILSGAGPGAGGDTDYNEQTDVCYTSGLENPETK